MELLQVLKGRKKSQNTVFRILLTVVIIGYGIFFTSKLWFPSSGDLVEATPYYAEELYNDYELYLTQWEYSEKDSAMQIIVELENKGLLEEEFEFSAVERENGTLDLTVELQEPEYAVLRINSVPLNWREISLRVGQGDKIVKFYMNMDAIESVDTLPEKDNTGYEIDRLLAQADMDTAQINEKNSEVKSLKKENRELEKRINDLKNDSYLSEEEAEKAGETVKSAEEKIKTNEDNISMLQEEIKTLDGRTENIMKQVEELQGGEAE